MKKKVGGGGGEEEGGEEGGGLQLIFPLVHFNLKTFCSSGLTLCGMSVNEETLLEHNSPITE